MRRKLQLCEFGIKLAHFPEVRRSSPHDGRLSQREIRLVRRYYWLLILQRETHLNLRVNLDRIVVQEVGLVLPLFDGFNGGGRQEWMSTDQLKFGDVTFLVDHRLQHNDALNALFLGVGRIFGLNFGDE